MSLLTRTRRQTHRTRTHQARALVPGVKRFETRILLSTISDLGRLGGPGLSVAEINDSGQIVGSKKVNNSTYRGFFRGTNGAIQELEVIADRMSSYANGLNSFGQVVGYSETPGGGGVGGGANLPMGFLYTGGRMTELGTLPSGNMSIANGINDSGQIVGWANQTNGPRTAFLYQNGTMTDIGGLLGYSSSVASAINNSGQVVGYSDLGGFGGSGGGAGGNHAFLYSGGTFTDLGTLSGSQSMAYDINSSGQVVGAWGGDGLTLDHAFLWSGGVMTDLGTLRGQKRAVATSINDSGQIVGTASNPTGGGMGGDSSTSLAFLYANGKISSLNSLLPVNSGWELNTATSINNKGVIVGLGTFKGETHGYALDISPSAPSPTDPRPIPNPPPTTTPRPGNPGQPSNPGGIAPTTPAASRSPRWATQITTIQLPGNVRAGRPITVLASIRAVGSRRRLPAGVLSIRDGDRLVAQATILGGKARFRLNNLPAGHESIRVEYGGNAEFTSSSSDLFLQPPRVARSSRVPHVTV